MAELGFTYYDEPTPVPTTQEILATLTAQQKLAVLNGFALKRSPSEIKQEHFIPARAVRHLYERIDAVEERCRVLMKLSTPPADQAALTAIIEAEFVTDWNPSQVDAIINKMVDYSKRDGSGTWAFYSVAVAA